MQTQNELVQEDEASLETVLSEEDKFRHEIEYLRGRVSNLESFKEKFFALQKKVPKAAASVVESVIDTQQVSKLEADLKNATNMAMLSMTTTGEYGTVVDFLKKA